MNEKMLIDLDVKAMKNMIQQAFLLNPNFSKRPHYFLSPKDDGTWRID